MDDQEYIYDGPLDEAALRKWAYDTDMLLIEQDEDLFIGRPEDYVLWFDILNDLTCPRYDSILAYIDSHFRQLVLHDQLSSARNALQKMSELGKDLKNSKTDSLIESSRSRLAYLENDGPVSEKQAIEMARAFLLEDRDDPESLEFFPDSSLYWLVGQRHMHTRLRINRKQGFFKLVVEPGLQ